MTDSVALLGSANVKLVNVRIDSVKPNLPSRYKSLCSSSGDFSGKLLFGDTLQADLKALSEESKLRKIWALTRFAVSYLLDTCLEVSETWGVDLGSLVVDTLTQSSV